MPHNSITRSAFVRTAITTCDVFVLALGYLEGEGMITPEQLIESASPWFLDAETIWWRKFVVGCK
ncbi:hypothetical protein BU24DRAFT_357865 [Aaosphaeria arxii CBS 175.79]|uniref:Uncharacterized protein n=1 Tax=Aaosphaeria arxii CBS 175.79 TaxID=1450172 RepID=A0A6A5X9Z6_9PLEO|nr:uncharacterized protein BU24DRAFT_357865 [Aaosphaeria arxii CBS 175.79]KAF2009763.1 hypothetical protein BU24DRAFT_357865 [Aaosphaeria arxii CBS 175.79]